MRTVDVAELDETAVVAASRMNTRNVETLIVTDDLRSPVGIITDRDLAVRVVAKGLEASKTSVETVMSELPESVTESTSIETALATMRRGAHRRLPVVDERNQLVGLPSLDDGLVQLSEEFREIGKIVRKESLNVVTL